MCALQAVTCTDILNIVCNWQLTVKNTFLWHYYCGFVPTIPFDGNLWPQIHENNGHTLRIIARYISWELEVKFWELENTIIGQNLGIIYLTLHIILWYNWSVLHYYVKHWGLPFSSTSRLISGVYLCDWDIECKVDRYTHYIDDLLPYVRFIIQLQGMWSSFS